MKRVLLQLVLLFTVCINAFAQTHTVTGKVVDQHGEGLPGTDISVWGANIGTVSDANGDWLLEVPDGKMVFYVQALGYNARTVEDSSQFILIQMLMASKEQEGSIATSLWIERERREVGYNAQTVDNESLNDGGNVSAIAGLAGKITGANISTNGGYGGSTNIVLRGDKSFLQNTNALIVVDGVVTNNFQRTASSLGISNILNQVDFGNSANDINPEDVASVTVLEGPAAATLYGSQGANGAILITTKAGVQGCKNNKMEVSYKMSYTQFEASMVPDVQNRYGQGDVYSGLQDYRATNYSWGLPFDNSPRPWGQIISGKQLVKPYADQPNNTDYFFNQSNALSNYVSVKGSGENSTYFLSLNAINGTGIVPNDFYNRYNARFNGSVKLSNNFYSSINFNYMNSTTRAEYEGDGGPTGNSGIMESVINTPRDIPLWELSNYNNRFYNMNYLDSTGIRRYGNYSSKYANPYWSAAYFDNRNTSDRVTGDAKIGYKNGDFNIFDRIAVDYNSDRSTYITPQYISKAADQTGVYPGTSYLGTGFTSYGGYAEAHYNGTRFSNDLIGNYNHPISQDWDLDVTLGTNVTVMHDAVFNSIVNPISNGLVIPEFYNFSNSINSPTSYNSITDHRIVGIFGSVKLNYLKEFYVELSGRNDWSSTFDYFSPQYYPGANASWVFTERLKGPVKDKLLNFGKIRMGAAYAGNDAIPYANNNAGYQQLPITSTNGSITTPFNGIPAYQIQNAYGDQNLKPEVTREFEMGTDLSFFRDRMSYSFTYYYAYSTNLIAAVPVAPSSGFTYNYANIGDVSNQGEEMSLRITPIKTNWGLKWDVFGSYSHNDNNVEKLNGNVKNVILGGVDGMEIVATKDHPLGTFYGADISYWQNPKDGSWHPIVDATTGLPVPTDKPVYRGSYQPTFVGAFGTDLSWNGLKLHVLFTTKQGGYYFSQEKELMDINGTALETTVNDRKPVLWSSNAVNQIGNTNSYIANTTKYLPYDYYVNELGGNKLPAQNLVSASYIKLQELSLSYRIPQKYYARTMFGGLEAGLFGNNLIIWNSAGNQFTDADVATSMMTGNNTGISYSGRPSVRSYGFYFKVTF